MPRSMVGLLAAVGAAMFALAGFVSGLPRWVLIVAGFAATWLAARQVAPLEKKRTLPG
jgi:hypothetical protein